MNQKPNLWVGATWTPPPPIKPRQLNFLKIISLFILHSGNQNLCTVVVTVGLEVEHESVMRITNTTLLNGSVLLT